MAFEDTLAELDGAELTPSQQQKLAEIKRLAVEKGYLKSINPGAQPNPRREALVTTPPATPTFGQQATEFLTKDVPEIGAATVGGMAGARQAARLPLPGLLRPIGIGIGGILGAAGGLTTTRGARTMVEQGAPLTVDQMLAEAKRSGAEAATGEGISQGLRLLGRSYTAGKRYLTTGRPATADELQTFETAKGMGVHLRPADVTKSPAALRTEQTLRGTQAGTDIFKRQDLANQENFKRAYDTELSDLVASQTTPGERGQLIQDVLEGKVIPHYQEMARYHYDALRKMTGGEKIVVPTEAFALAQQLKDSVNAQANPKMAGVVNRIYESIAQPGMQSGLHVERLTREIPGTERLTGLKTKVNTALPGGNLLTGMSVKEVRGEPSIVDQAIEDLGGKPAERPLLGLNIRRKSEGSESPIVTGLKVSPQYETGPSSRQLSGLKAEVTSRLPDRPRPMDFMEAHNVRSMLGELGKTGEQLPTREKGIAKNLWNILGHEMEQGALRYKEKTGIDITPAWRRADSFVRDEGHALFDANVISKMMKASPEDVVTASFKPNNVTEVNTVVKALSRLDDTTGLDHWRRGILEHLWDQGVVKQGIRRNEFSGSKFADTVAHYGEPTIQAALGPQVYPRFKKFVQIASDMDPKAASGYGISLVDKGVLIAAPLYGIGSSIMSGNAWPLVDATATAGAWLLGTRHLSKILNDPKASEQLLRAMRAKPGSEVYSRAIGQLAAIEGGKTLYPPEKSTPPAQTGLRPAP